MNYRSHMIIFFTVSLFFVSVLPVVNYLKNPQQTHLKNMFNVDILESYRNYFLLEFFNRSVDKEKVIAGKNGFLFLGNKQNHVITQTQNLYPHKPQDIENWIKKFNAMQNWFEKVNIPFVMAVVPNKHTVYKDDLPDWIMTDRGKISEKILQIAHKDNMKMLDLKPILLREKEKMDELIYFQLDSHWNQLGAAIGYEAIIDNLNNLYDLELTKVAFYYKKSKQLASDLKRLLKIKAFELKQQELVSNYDIEDEKKYVMEKSTRKPENFLHV